MTYHQVVYYISSKGNLDKIYRIGVTRNDGGLLYQIIRSNSNGWNLFYPNGLPVIGGVSFELTVIIRAMFGLSNAQEIAGINIEY